jgi:membrane protein YdbS with pleckstrin-like domain
MTPLHNYPYYMKCSAVISLALLFCAAAIGSATYCSCLVQNWWVAISSGFVALLCLFFALVFAGAAFKWYRELRAFDKAASERKL